MNLQPLDENNASERAAETLAAVRKQLGFIPNLLGIMAHAPASLESYLALAGKFDSTSLDKTQRQVVVMAVSQSNHCDYCAAAHTTMAKQQRIDPDIITALYENTPIADRKLESLRQFAQQVAQSQGRPSAQQIQAFLDAGYDESQILEVVLGVAFKTLSNYTSHVTDVVIDPAFKSALQPV
jgi:uncharacterized peroxidase-related enzyme